MLVHPDIAHGGGLWRSMPSAAGLWLVLKPAVTGAASDVYLGGVYIPPAQSALLRTSSASDRFAALTEAASERWRQQSEVHAVRRGARHA